MSSKIVKKIIFDVRPGELLQEYGLNGLSKILSKLKSPIGRCFQTIQDGILSEDNICKLPHDTVGYVIDYIIEKEDHLEVHVLLWKDFDEATIKNFRLYLSGLVTKNHVLDPNSWMLARLSLGDAIKVNPFIISKIKEIVYLDKTYNRNACGKLVKINEQLITNIVNDVVKKLFGEPGNDCLWTIYNAMSDTSGIRFNLDLNKRILPDDVMTKYKGHGKVDYDGTWISLETRSKHATKENLFINHFDIIKLHLTDGYQSFHWPQFTIKNILSDVDLESLSKDCVIGSSLNESTIDTKSFHKYISPTSVSDTCVTHSDKTRSYTLIESTQSGKKEVFSINVEKDTEIIVDDENKVISFNVMFKEG